MSYPMLSRDGSTIRTGQTATADVHDLVDPLLCRDAARGDVKQQALLGQMLNEGYGCAKDPAAAAEWIERARRRGYKMDGVYCKL